MKDNKENAKDEIKTPVMRGATRDESKMVMVKITKPGNFLPTNPNRPTELKEYKVGEKVEVSIGRANGMKNKCEILK